MHDCLLKKGEERKQVPQFLLIEMLRGAVGEVCSHCFGVEGNTHHSSTVRWKERPRDDGR